MSGRIPDFTVGVWHRPSKTSGNVGVAWAQDDGRISIKLNPGALLQFDPEMFVTLFPYKEKPSVHKPPRVKSDNPDDDIPF